MTELPHNIHLPRASDIKAKIDLLMPKNTKILLLNAPPFSGKDELTDIIFESHPEMFRRLEFKFKIKELFMTIFNVSEELFNEVSKSQNKDTPYPELNNLSYRNCMKMIPELMIKPHLGQTYFSEALISKIDPTKINLITDCGFQEPEADFFQSRIDSHNIKLGLVKIHRAGCDYSNDSRNWVELTHPKSITLGIENPWDGNQAKAAFHRAKFAVRSQKVLDELFKFFDFYPDDIQEVRP